MRLDLDFIARRLDAYERLLRLDKPIGTLLLLWPTLWAVWLAAGGSPSIEVIAIFCVGTLLMRSAGCALNDFADRKFDAHVERTRDRPLPRARSRLRRRCRSACCSPPRVRPGVMLNRFALMPFIHCPGDRSALPVHQALLRAAATVPWRRLRFASRWLPAIQWRLPAECWALLAANVFYAFAYDTEYAMGDREDDAKIHPHCCADAGAYDVAAVIASYAAMLATLAGVGAYLHLNWPYYPAGARAAMMAFHYRLIRGRSRAGCFKAFQHNNWVGAAVRGGIIASYSLR